MLKAFSLAALSIALLASPASADTGARVYCWAPHLKDPILLDSHGQGIGSYAGRPYGYKIFGVAGVITLGDQCDGAFPDPNDLEKHFRTGTWIGNLGSRTNISSHVKLQVNWKQYYPARLEVTGDRPGSTSGPVRIYSETWETTTMFGYPEVTLVFHLAGSEEYAIPNRNPSGYFYVVAEYLTSPPKLNGKLTVSKQSLLRNTTATVGYTIDRKGGTTTTPPFEGYDPNSEVIFLNNQ